MSRVYADNVYPELVTEDLTLGASGDSVVVTSGASLNVNTLKDSGGNTIFTSNGSGTLSSLNSAFGGPPTLITTNTTSSATSLSFTSDIDSTYKVYMFKMIDIINPDADGAYFGVQFNAAGQSGFNETMTTTYYSAQHSEAGSDAVLSYHTAYDQSQGTDLQKISRPAGAGADETLAGTLFLFNPSSTTFIKNYYSTTQFYFNADYSMNVFVGGVIDVTAAIDEVEFKFTSGNVKGTIKMYGI